MDWQRFDRLTSLPVSEPRKDVEDFSLAHRQALERLRVVLNDEVCDFRLPRVPRGDHIRKRTQIAGCQQIAAGLARPIGYGWPRQLRLSLAFLVRYAEKARTTLAGKSLDRAAVLNILP